MITALQATLPQSLSSHTLLFAFLGVIAILVLKPDGLISIRFGLFTRAWHRLRRPEVEGTASA